MKRLIDNNEEEREERFDLSLDIDSRTKKFLENYMTYLMEYNKKINIVSRKITDTALRQLIGETILMERYISKNIILDAGSGNGILGIPIALINPGKRLYLIEKKAKKAHFLEEIKTKMELKNVCVYCSSIEEFIKKKDLFDSDIKAAGDGDISLITRGFPGIELFFRYVKKGIIKEAVLITSKNKIKKIEKDMVNVKKKAYNIPMRKNLRILKMENVSRET